MTFHLNQSHQFFLQRTTNHKSFILSHLLSGSKIWPLSADLERRIQASEIKCYGRMLGMSCRKRKTNESVWQQTEVLVGRHEILVSTLERRKLSCFGHVCQNAIRCRKPYYMELMEVVREEDVVNHGGQLVIAAAHRG